MKSLLEYWEEQRIKLWCEVWANTANATDCKKPETATRYAEEAVKAFELKFPKPRE